MIEAILRENIHQKASIAQDNDSYGSGVLREDERPYIRDTEQYLQVWRNIVHNIHLTAFKYISIEFIIKRS